MPVLVDVRHARDGDTTCSSVPITIPMLCGIGPHAKLMKSVRRKYERAIPGCASARPCLCKVTGSSMSHQYSNWQRLCLGEKEKVGWMCTGVFAQDLNAQLEGAAVLAHEVPVQQVRVRACQAGQHLLRTARSTQPLPCIPLDTSAGA